MHFEGTVVTIVDDKKKPIREFDSVRENKGRKCKVFMPFDTEYKLLVKNNDDRRIRLEIEIDGSIVSGNGLIINAHSTDYIERFVEIAKKFKFVKAGNEAVADPSNKENGLIKVRVATESRKVTPIIHTVEHHYDYWRPTPYWNYPYSQTTWCGTSSDSYSVGNSVHNSDNNFSIDRKTIVPENHVFLNQVQASLPVGEAGATIEGSNSDQSFTTTSWNGDDEISWFTFHISGVDIKKDPEYEKYMELKKKFE